MSLPQHDPLDSKLEFHGPFEEASYKFTIGGYLVPNVRGYRKGENEWSLVLDGRFGIDCSHQELQNWLWFMAHGMAISAGYTHFGPEAKKRDGFSSMLYGVTSVETDEFPTPPDVWSAALSDDEDEDYSPFEDIDV